MVFSCRSDCVGSIQFLVMTDQGLVVTPMPVVESISFAIFIILALGADSGLCPASVPEEMETGFPDLIEIVLIDVPLAKGVVDVRTCRNGAVD